MNNPEVTPKRGGRPRHTGEDIRSRYVSIRLTQAEWEQLKRLAGHYPLNTWARAKLLEVAEELDS